MARVLGEPAIKSTWGKTMNKKDLPINDPCHEDWDAMDGAAERRFCDICTKDVHNLSEMTRRGAESLLDAERAAGRRVCVRYRHNRSGRLLFRQREVEATAPVAQRRGVSRLLAGAAMIASMLSAPLAGASTLPQDTAPESQVLEQERRAASTLRVFGLELEEEFFAELEVEPAGDAEAVEEPGCAEKPPEDGCEEGGEGCKDAGPELPPEHEVMGKFVLPEEIELMGEPPMEEIEEMGDIEP